MPWLSATGLENFHSATSLSAVGRTSPGRDAPRYIFVKPKSKGRNQEPEIWQVFPLAVITGMWGGVMYWVVKNRVSSLPSLNSCCECSQALQCLLSLGRFVWWQEVQTGSRGCLSNSSHPYFVSWALNSLKKRACDSLLPTFSSLISCFPTQDMYNRIHTHTHTCIHMCTHRHICICMYAHT